MRAINKGAALGGFAHDTGEGGLTEHHLAYGADLSGRSAPGTFGAHQAAASTRTSSPTRRQRPGQVHLAQAQPGRQARLRRRAAGGQGQRRRSPRTRGVPDGQNCVSPAAHRAFRTPRELIVSLPTAARTLAGGKPVGFKLCVGSRVDVLAICKAMLEEGITPDFIIVDGAEGGTAAAPLEYEDHVGHAADRGADAGAQRPGRHRAAGPDPDRRQRQGGQRHRHRQTPDPGRRLHQRRAGDDDGRRLHPGADVPHQRVPGRSGHPGSAPGPGARRAGQERTGATTTRRPRSRRPCRLWPRWGSPTRPS